MAAILNFKYADNKCEVWKRHSSKRLEGKAVYGSSLSYHLIPRNELIKTTSTLVYYGGLASGDWIILEYSGSLSLKAEVNSKGERRWKDLMKCHWAVGALNFTEHEVIERRLIICGMLFAVVADKLDLYSAERRLEKEKCSFYCVLNKCTWCAYKTPSVLDNCQQLCIFPFYFNFRSLDLASRMFLRDNLCPSQIHLK